MSAPAEPPDVDAEREVDLHTHWNRLVERWWLPAAGLVAGIVIGLLVSFGGNQVYTAKTTVYLGQPLSPTGAVQIQSDATNPSTVGQIIHSEEALREAAFKAGVPVARLRGHVTSRPVAGALTKLGQTPLVLITVTGKTPRPTQVAANDLAQIVVKRTSAYVDKIISSLQQQIAIYTRSLATLNTQSSGLSSTEARVLAAIQAAQIADQLTTAKQQLAVAQEVERGSQKTFAVSTKTTARSRRNTVIVGALIGLLIGIAAALLWEPVGRVVRHDS
ncbi:MAG TPA: Wzz/FepE/Etk N-terminal domain-containing protein [Gaiellaceae bacterium]|nr:Wzz/FepE/Etk N-terminal domain-containing protein [Gaiellaceae bacterium]